MFWWMAGTDTHDAALQLVVLHEPTPMRAWEGLLRRGGLGVGLISHLKNNRDGFVAASAELAQRDTTHGPCCGHLQTATP
jgi:hypothetical protein